MSPNIAVIGHMYHPDLYAEIMDTLRRIPYWIDVYFAVPSNGCRRLLTDLCSDISTIKSVAIEVVPNRGRDIATKFVTFRDVYRGYDYVLLVHTKASIPEWRQWMLSSLAGTPQTVSTIIHAFERNPRLGVVAGEHYEPITPWVHWSGNAKYAKPLADRMGITLPRHVDFPSGSMFWARPAALQPILDLNLTYDDLPPEPVPGDKTVLHAIERLIYLSALRAGYGWTNIAIRDEVPSILAPCHWPTRHPVADLITPMAEDEGVPASATLRCLAQIAIARATAVLTGPAIYSAHRAG
jgi:lipopolysaccharide biosynthesis protein